VKQHVSVAIEAQPGTGGAALLSPAWPKSSRNMTRTLISAYEWILAVPPPGTGSADPEITRGLAGILAGEARFRFTPTQATAIVRVRSSQGTPDIGAVLHYRHGTAVLYCPADQLETLGAAALSTVANEAEIFSRPRPGDAARTITVEQVSHDSPVHPAAVAVSPRSHVFLICERLIDARLADMIGQVWTAHAQLVAVRG
jgi:hypothetical protein